MPRNVEIKARVASLEDVKALASALSDRPEPEVLKQWDTFFNVPNGRLKLRHLEDRPSQLIFYSRSDQEGPKLSDYRLVETDKAEDMRETLRMALGIKGEVRKTRLLYLVGQTRIHVDDVDGLGHFVELEVVLRDEQTLEEGEKIAKDIMDKLKVDHSKLIPGAYMDLILNNAAST